LILDGPFLSLQLDLTVLNLKSKCISDVRKTSSFLRLVRSKWILNYQHIPLSIVLLLIGNKPIMARTGNWNRPLYSWDSAFYCFGPA